ncbi:MAG: hypothetical protein ABIM31_06410 [candidate division WOR-3 bacterium]
MLSGRYSSFGIIGKDKLTKSPSKFEGAGLYLGFGVSIMQGIVFIDKTVDKTLVNPTLYFAFEPPILFFPYFWLKCQIVPLKIGVFIGTIAPFYK